MKHALLFVLLASMISESALASRMELIFGPASTGNGGSNPLQIPPGTADIQFNYVTDRDSEWVFSVLPGFFYGKRQDFDMFYASFGGGLAVNINGVGPGINTGFGISLGDTWIFSAEYRQALGLDFGGTVISPYALRAGLSVEF